MIIYYIINYSYKLFYVIFKKITSVVRRILKYMNFIINLILFYKMDIHLELYGYANMGGDLNNCGSNFDYMFLYDIIYIS